MEELIQELRDAGFSDEEIERHLTGGLRGDIRGGAASFLQGATLGLGGAAHPQMKRDAEQFGQEHKILGPVTNLAGNVAGGLALPVAAGGRFLARLLTGAGAAGINSATGGGDAREVARDAAIGGGLGVALPPAVRSAGRAISRAADPLKSASRQVANGAGPLLPRDAAARMAELERLAPGTATPVNVSPGMAKSTRVLGANAPLAREAQEAAEGRIGKMQTSMNAVSSEYEQLLAGKTAPLMIPGKGSPNILPLAMKYGVWPGQGDVELLTIQKLRSSLRMKRETVKGMARAEIGKDIKSLTRWLETNEPEVATLDKKWGVLSSAKRSEEKTVKHIAQSRESYGSSRVSGIEPGSPGASLPTKANIFTRAFGPDRRKLAEEANRLLLTPGTIPTEMLRARAHAAAPYQPGLLAPFTIGGQTPEILGLFD